MAGKVNFSVIKGDTFNKNVTFRVKSTQTPIDLNSCIVSGKVKKNTSEVALTCAIVNAGAGKFKFGLSAAQTAALETGINQIEVQITYADQTVQTIISGNLVVKEQLV